jgi:hypothetical protein
LAVTVQQPPDSIGSTMNGTVDLPVLGRMPHRREAERRARDSPTDPISPP